MNPMNNYYQVTVHLDKLSEEGMQKKVAEQYLVQAPSFGAAERAIVEEIAQYATGELEVVAIARRNYSEIITDKYGIVSHIDGEARKIFGQNNVSTEPDKWFKCKLNFITLDEKSGREKKTPRLFLVNANTAMTAHQLVDNFMAGSISDYEVQQIDETKILDVYILSTPENVELAHKP